MSESPRRSRREDMFDHINYTLLVPKGEGGVEGGVPFFSKMERWLKSRNEETRNVSHGAPVVGGWNRLIYSDLYITMGVVFFHINYSSLVSKRRGGTLFSKVELPGKSRKPVLGKMRKGKIEFNVKKM